MNYKEIADKILSCVGGEENVIDAANCMTRLRFTLKDNNLIKMDEINAVDGIVGVQIKSGQLQVIIGPEVGEVFKELPESVRAKEVQVDVKAEGNIFSRAISTFSAFFFPLVIVMGGAGIVKALVSIAVNFQWLSVESDVYAVFNIISDGVFYFLPFFLAYTVAKRIKTNEVLALALAAMLMYPTLINGAAAGGGALSFFGLPIPMFSYSSSVVPIILGVFALKYVFLFFSKFIPKSLELIVTSALSLVVVGILMLIVLAPLGTYIGTYVTSFFTWLFDVAGPLASMLLCAVFPLLVITGMAYSFFPVVFLNMATYGYDFINLPIMIFANINQGIAALAVALKTKNMKLRSLGVSSGVTAILGITEPAMYSVNLRYKRPFYCIIAGNALAGLLSGIFKVKMFAVAGSGALAIPAFSSVEYPQNFMYAMISLFAGMILTFVLTWIFTPKDMLNDM